MKFIKILEYLFYIFYYSIFKIVYPIAVFSELTSTTVYKLNLEWHDYYFIRLRFLEERTNYIFNIPSNVSYIEFYNNEVEKRCNILRNATKVIEMIDDPNIIKKCNYKDYKKNVNNILESSTSGIQYCYNNKFIVSTKNGYRLLTSKEFNSIKI